MAAERQLHNLTLSQGAGTGIRLSISGGAFAARALRVSILFFPRFLVILQKIYA